MRGFLRAGSMLLLLSLAVAWICADRLVGFTDRTDARTVEIPDFCGQTEKELILPDWTEVSIEYRYDPTAPRGTVLSQSPPAGSRHKLSGSAPMLPLRLLVSLGQRSVRLWSVLGGDVREACAKLRGEGLTVRVEPVRSTQKAGTVLSQHPSVGTVMTEGNEVLLTVSAGTTEGTVTVPDVRGLSRADALMRLWLEGLSAGEVLEVEADAPEGTVVRQSHLAGTEVRIGTRIVLYISREDPSHFRFFW